MDPIEIFVLGAFVGMILVVVGALLLNFIVISRIDRINK